DHLAAPMSAARSHALFSPRLRLTPAAADDVELLVGMHDAPGPPDDARAERVRALVASNAERFAQHGFGLWVVRAGSAAGGRAAAGSAAGSRHASRSCSTAWRARAAARASLPRRRAPCSIGCSWPRG